ncbi:PQQ-binding-like beta-propeller repeat protein [Borrelia coriaceae]|uniref:outer membrane protein assembly factor BamB family protein n=1 Tax=Borrelia coriaceae TaxID=144 RepID=UPI00046CF88E|nr:PQQ-binding-like beta-propeller repeat protein [Borrelia coriaceae]UPA16586.1 PQQ-binding-like beta-propeller repeat protein [Borrelia coriaceae]
MKFNIFIFVFLGSYVYLSADVNLYFQKALTGQVLGSPILDERRDTITVLTKDRWLITYTMSLDKKYSYRLDRIPYPFLLKDFGSGYYVITGRNEVQKIRRGKLIWRYRLDVAPIKAPSIGNGYILIPQVDGRVVALRLGDGQKVFEVNIEGQAVTSSVVLENGNFYIANDNCKMFAFNSQGEQIWITSLMSLPNVLMLSTNHEIIVGYQSGDVVVYDSDFGDILSSISLNYPINFLFEKFNGEYIAVSNDGIFFNLSRNLELMFSKDLPLKLKEAMLYNNKSLFVVVKSNGVLAIDEYFQPVDMYDDMKEISGLVANVGIIITGGLNWILTAYYYEYKDELDVIVWNHTLGNRYHQNRIDFRERSLVDHEDVYLALDEMLDSTYSMKTYNNFLSTLDSLVMKYGSFPKKYLNLYEKVINNWLAPKNGVDRIVQRGQLYKYFMYVDDSASVKSFINMAIEEKDISNVIQLVKGIAKFDYYYEQDELVYNYIQYIILNYQGNLDIAYAVVLSLRKIILNSTEDNLKRYKSKYLTLLKFIKRQNFSDRINQCVNEIIMSL